MNGPQVADGHNDLGVLLHGCVDFVQVLERGGQVSVHKQFVATLGLVDAQAYVATLPYSWAGVNDAEVLEMAGFALGNLGRAIGAVGHYQKHFHLAVVAGLQEGGQACRARQRCPVPPCRRG